MVGEDRVIMSVKELRRVHVLRHTLEKQLTQVKAGALLGLTARQVRRLLQRMRAEGDAGLAHRGRGQPSNRRIPEPVKIKVLELYGAGMPILGRRWRRRSWRSSRGSRSATRPCGCGCGREGSIISRGGSGHIGCGGRGSPLWGSWSNWMAPIMTGSRGAARDVC